MADTKIGDAANIDAVAAGDEFPVADASAATSIVSATAAQIKTFVNNAPVFAAGGTGAGTWPLMTAGTLLTTPEAGALERDADNLYGTVDAGNRGIIPVVHYIRAASAQTLTSQTAAQNIFDSPAGGAITLEAGSYLFEMLALFTGMSATTGNGQILFGGTGTFADWMWMSNAIDGVAGTTLLDLDNAFNVTNASAALVAATQVNTTLRVYAKGAFECSAGGTWIPQIALTTAAAATVAAGSHCLVHRIGAQATASVGQWS